jgi:NTE family protein
MNPTNESIPYYTHLILGGGGFSGLIYIGIYRFFKEHNILKNIRYISGTSIGALFAFFIGLKIDYDYMEDAMMGRNKHINTGFCYKNETTEYNPSCILKLHTTMGMYSTERFRKYIVDFLKEKYEIEDITFSEYIKLTGIDIHIHTTCLNTYSPLDLCNDNFPEMSLITAVLASMSVPLIFQPVIYKEYVLVDGGCSANLQMYKIAKNLSNKVLYITIGTDITFTKELLTTNAITYSGSIMLSMIASHTKHIIDEYKNVFDILEISKNPIPFIQLNFEDNMFYSLIEKSQLEESIVYGYQSIYEFFISKRYFEQTS